jgi:hypothetical protein
VNETIGRRIELRPRIGEHGTIHGSLGFGQQPDSRFVARCDEHLAIDFFEWVREVARVVADSSKVLRP